MKNYNTEEYYSDKQIVEKVIDFCLSKYKFIFISGNGGSGKTTLGNEFVSKINSLGLESNYIDMDEFVLDTKMRKSGEKEWIDLNNNIRKSSYTTSFKESYYLNAVETIVYSLNKGLDCYFKRKKTNEFIKLKAKLPITIIEGVGASFLEKGQNTFGIFLKCDNNIEIKRRIDRGRDGEKKLSKDEIEKNSKERREQFDSIVLPESKKFDLEIISNKDYSFNIMRDDLKIFNL